MALSLDTKLTGRPLRTFDSNPTNPNPDLGPKPQPKRAKTRHNRGCAAFDSNQEISQLQTTIPKCRPRYAFFKSKTSLKIPSPRLLNLLSEIMKINRDTVCSYLHSHSVFSCYFSESLLQLEWNPQD